MKKVLITSTGSVACDIVIKSLKRMGYYLIGCNIYPKEWVVESNEVNEFFQAPPVSSEEEYLSFIKQLCKKLDINYIYPMIDYEVDLFNVNREWFEENNIRVCMSPKYAIDIIRDKKKLQDFTLEHCPELNPIPTVRMTDFNIDTASFPIVCKPYNGRSSQGLKYISSKKEYLEFIPTIDRARYIVEPFISGPIVMVETIRNKDTKQIITLTRREVLSTPNGCSTTVYVFQDKNLEKNTRKLADLLDVNGDVNFEYILDENGKYHLVECNPRFSAGCEFSCIAGYDCVENHMKCFEGLEIEDYEFKHTMVIARKYEEYITAVNCEVPYTETKH